MLHRSYALAQPGLLVQTVRIPAVLVHCHWSLNITLATGSDRVNPTEANAAVPATARIAMVSTVALRVQKVHVIAFNSHSGAPRIRASASLLCERCHNSMILFASPRGQR
jgi:hypothetical protein